MVGDEVRGDNVIVVSGGHSGFCWAVMVGASGSREENCFSYQFLHDVTVGRGRVELRARGLKCDSRIRFSMT